MVEVQQIKEAVVADDRLPAPPDPFEKQGEAIGVYFSLRGIC